MSAEETRRLLSEAQAFAAQGAFDAALARIDALIAADPSSAAGYFNRGNLLLQMRRFAEAVCAYDEALARKSNVQIWLNRAVALRELDRNAEALASFDNALALDPANVSALIGKGVALGMLERPAEALAAFDAALAQAPESDIAHHNRGKALYALERFADARAAYEEALRRDPNYASAWNNYGVALEALGRRADSIVAYERAVALRRERESAAIGSQNPLFNLAVARLRAGEYAEGFALYERRFEAGAASIAEGAGEAPTWTGAPLDGVLRIWAEQGLGDQILFTRLLSLVLERAPNIALELEPRLVPLLNAPHPTIDVRPRTTPLREAAAQIALGSLPHVLGVTLESFPLNAPLLRAGPEAVARLRENYCALAGGRPIVGIAWASPAAPYARQKSAALAEWGPLLSGDYFFVSLQYGDARAAITAANAPIHVDPNIDQLTDLMPFAAQVAVMDHIVTVSNTLAHLAGAMGLAAHVIVPSGRGLHWYWGLEGAATPWYPSLRLARRTLDEPWSTPIARVAAELKKMLGERR